MPGVVQGMRGVVLGVANQKSIAWGCAQRLAAEGAELALSYLGDAQEKRVRALASELGAEPVLAPCDVTDDESVSAFFDAIRNRWEKIDFLIHSVAFTEKDCLRQPFVQTSRANYLSTMDVSAYSLVAVSRLAAPLMKDGGSILCMSYYGAEKVVPKYNVMGVAKAALESTARYLAYDLGPQGIRVNALSAGPIRTLSSSAIPGIKDMLDAAERHAPLRRNVTQQDIAASSLFLLSPLSSGVTGEVLHVDCGYNTLGMYSTGETTDVT
jgi:enoyl-[acyl-carrier protein] reductase I